MTQQSAAQVDVGVAEPTVDELVEAERRVPDVAQYAGGVSSDSQHAALRASVRQLGQLLGEALTRHEGAELLAQVERIRRLSREHRDDELHAELESVDDATAVRLARAFTAYFQLVNITEQLHRWREIAAGEEGPLAATARRMGEALDKGTIDRDLISDVLSRLEYRPVFTAHPTEASRRSVLELLRKIADVVAALEDPQRSPGQTPPAGASARRAGRPALADRRAADRPSGAEGRGADRRSTTCSRWLRRSCPICWRSSTGCSAPSTSSCRPTARPLRFGTWAGGDRDGNPNVTPAVTLDVLALQHDFGLRTLIAGLEELLDEMSASTRVVAVTEDLLDSLARRRRGAAHHLRGAPRGSTPRSRTGSS